MELADAEGAASRGAMQSEIMGQTELTNPEVAAEMDATQKEILGQTELTNAEAGDIPDVALEARRQARREMASASSAIAQRVALLVWARNERRMAADRIGTQSSSGASRDKTLCRKVCKLQVRVGDTPDALLPHLDSLEGAQPWSERLATAMAGIESRLMGL